MVAESRAAEQLTLSGRTTVWAANEPVVSDGASVNAARAVWAGATLAPAPTAATTSTSATASARRRPPRGRAPPSPKASTIKPATTNPPQSWPSRLVTAEMTYPPRGIVRNTRSAMLARYAMSSADLFASPFNVSAYCSPSLRASTTRCMTRTPSGLITLATSPTRSSPAGTGRDNATSPVEIAGSIDPDVTTSGLTPMIAVIATHSRQMTPRIAPAVRTISRTRVMAAAPR